jgi:Kef-type K+ transport system membrane component KefB
MIPAIAVGSLMASHTLLAGPIVAQLGVNRLEPIIVTVGATVLSDTFSLVVFAMSVSTYEKGFSLSGFAVQLIEIAVFVPFILVGLSRVGAYVLAKVEAEENAYFVLTFGTMAIAGVLAQAANLPGIVGAFLAGLALNEDVRDKSVKDKLEFFGNAFFIPIFFIAMAFLIEPLTFIQSIVDNFVLVMAIIVTVIADKFTAAQVAGRAFGYNPAARMTMWSLSLPQVASTLAAALVALKTFDPLHQPLIDHRMLNVVFVLMVMTAILGPVLTQHFAPGMLSR